MTLTKESMQSINKGIENGFKMEDVLSQIDIKSGGRPLIKMLEEYYRSLEDDKDNSD